MDSGKTFRLLVVDDIPDNLALLCEVFEDEPCEMITASSAGEAMERIGDSAPDVAILDVQMPETDGYELCRQLRERFGMLDFPIVFLTAERTDSQSVVHGLDIGASDYVTKPFNAQELKARVRRLLRVRTEHQVRIDEAKTVTRRLFRNRSH